MSHPYTVDSDPWLIPILFIGVPLAIGALMGLSKLHDWMWPSPPMTEAERLRYISGNPNVSIGPPHEE